MSDEWEDTKQDLAVTYQAQTNALFKHLMRSVSPDWPTASSYMSEFSKISALPGITLTDKDDDGTQIEA